MSKANNNKKKVQAGQVKKDMPKKREGNFSSMRGVLKGGLTTEQWMESVRGG